MPGGGKVSVKVLRQERAGPGANVGPGSLATVSTALSCRFFLPHQCCPELRRSSKWFSGCVLLFRVLVFFVLFAVFEILFSIPSYSVLSMVTSGIAFSEFL